MGGWTHEEPWFDYRNGRHACLFPTTFGMTLRPTGLSVFLQSVREADHVPTCQRMRGAKLPLLDIASCLIQYVGYFTLHWRGFGW